MKFETFVLAVLTIQCSLLFVSNCQLRQDIQEGRDREEELWDQIEWDNTNF